MPTRNIDLSREQDQFIAELVETGEYPNASETVRDALRLLQQNREDRRRRHEALRRELDKGVQALEAGDFSEVDDAELDPFLESLAPRS